ncbi:PREDICTED: G-box-binding factor 4-like isoform X2 [Tarenaya hassleriana]|uniref:G-box-binding factor 4-like isoform X2 n=1 Tax=Tarenaya hassleriana TaxID=28532 RepID=UPI00053C2085|nr:PREDICTED: G-box-binding factor 4-like isoform X2 [Tarenaya hassleriana]
MASSKVMPSSNSRNSGLSRRNSSSVFSSPSVRSHQLKRDSSADRSRLSGVYDRLNNGFGSTITVDGILRDVYGTDHPAVAAESTLSDASISLMDPPAPGLVEIAVNVDRSGHGGSGGGMSVTETQGKSVDEVWSEIVSGERKEMKEEAQDEIMTLEDFLAKAAVDDTVGTAEWEDMDAKIPPERLGGGGCAFDPVPHKPLQMIDNVEGTIVGFGNGLDVYGGGGVGGRGGSRGKRARMIMEPLDKAAAQRHKRTIKNRESAARSRERKQAYQLELESLASKLEEENEQLSKEKAERTKERHKKLMERVIPAVEKPRLLRRVRSLEW